MCSGNTILHRPPSGDRRTYVPASTSSHAVRRAKSASDVRRRSNTQLQRAKYTLDTGKACGVRVSLVMTSAPSELNEFNYSSCMTSQEPLSCSGSGVMRRNDVTTQSKNTTCSADDVKAVTSRRPVSASAVVDRQIRKPRFFTQSSRLKHFVLIFKLQFLQIRQCN